MEGFLQFHKCFTFSSEPKQNNAQLSESESILYSNILPTNGTANKSKNTIHNFYVQNTSDQLYIDSRVSRVKMPSIRNFLLVPKGTIHMPRKSAKFQNLFF